MFAKVFRKNFYKTYFFVGDGSVVSASHRRISVKRVETFKIRVRVDLLSPDGK